MNTNIPTVDDARKVLENLPDDNIQDIREYNNVLYYTVHEYSTFACQLRILPDGRIHEQYCFLGAENTLQAYVYPSLAAFQNFQLGLENTYEPGEVLS